MPSAYGARVRMTGNRVTVTDGPFPLQIRRARLRTAFLRDSSNLL